MNTAIKQPRSAAATARVISRILKENGFKKAIYDRSNWMRWSEGFRVYRIGLSVHVAYHAAEHKEWKIAQMRELLFELGYISSHPHAIYIECQQS